MASADRIERGEETDSDLAMIFAPGSSLGGARPKASIKLDDGRLAIAKFPKSTDGYSLETWESIALTLAAQAGIRVAPHQRVGIDGKTVLVSTRFDRQGNNRVPFLSALAMLDYQDRERGSYLEIADILAETGGRPQDDLEELFRRVCFNVLVSNVDDHLRNHGFLHAGARGWELSPAYDLNPVPRDLKRAFLSTNIDLETGDCDIELVLETATDYRLSHDQAAAIIQEVMDAVSRWRQVAAQAGQTTREIERMASAFQIAG